MGSALCESYTHLNQRVTRRAAAPPPGGPCVVLHSRRTGGKPCSAVAFRSSWQECPFRLPAARPTRRLGSANFSVPDDPLSVPTAAVSTLEERHVSASKTGALVIGVLALAFVVVVAAFEAADLQ